MSGDYLAVFLIGLLGAGHCLGMCGGIASLLSINGRKTSHWTTLLYNTGRLSSYMLLGGLVGGAISSLSQLSGIIQPLAWLRLLSAVLMILVACYIAQWWHGLIVIERIGQTLWRIISPMTAHLLPLRKNTHAVPLGFLWGWLPCGLVYSALTWSAVSGSAMSGAMIMLSFGVGTLPAMFAIGYSAQLLNKAQKSIIFRNMSGVILVAYGIYTVWSASQMIV